MPNLLFAIKISPRHIHSSFRRQVLPGRLKSHAVQTSSVTIDGGWKSREKEKERENILNSNFRLTEIDLLTRLGFINLSQIFEKSTYLKSVR